MNLTPQTDHVAAGLSRLLEQFKDRPRIAALFTAFLQRDQQLEDALYPLATALQLNNATGAQLDIVGASVGVARQGLSDAQYRALLTGKIAQNNGDASLDTLIAVVKGMFLTDQVYVKTPNNTPHNSQIAPAVVTVSVQSPGIPDDVIPVAIASLKQALGAGVALDYLGRFQPKAFAFAGRQPWIQGFGVGAMAGAIYNDPVA